jgi:uncharacterized membrane protein YcaP (DUF421 family)
MDWELWLGYTWKTAGAFLALLAITRFLGKEQISQLTFYDYVMGITLGDLGAFLALGDTSFIEGLYVLVLFSLCAFGISLLTEVSRPARKIIEGQPTVIIHNGRLLEDNMRSSRYNIGNLMTQLRSKGFFDLAAVQFAVLETDGELSVMPKEEYRPLTPKDVGMFVPYKGMSIDLVADGKILRDNLQKCGVAEGWLLEELSRLGYASPRQVFYAGLDTSGKLYIDIRKDGLENDQTYL